MLPVLYRLACPVALLIMMTGMGRAVGSEPATRLEALVAQLDHPAFPQRQSASRSLVAAGTGTDAEVAARTRKALRLGLKHPSIEVRLASLEILREISQVEFDQQTRQLLNPRCDPDTIRVVGWKQVAPVAGEDMAARRFFAKICDRYPRAILEVVPNHRPDFRRLVATLDPYRLPNDDAVAWAVLLLTEIIRHDVPSEYGPRIGMTLSNPPMGPMISSENESIVLRRLIECWVRANDQPTTYAAHQRLLIAMRYNCHRLTSELVNQILADDEATPVAQISAILSASVLGRKDVESQARMRLDDVRTAHVWQLVASRKTKIRTQVRDVALAVLLHHHGIDPRQTGFDFLEADPLLMYRDHSLGFPDEDSRRQAHDKGMKMLLSAVRPVD